MTRASLGLSTPFSRGGGAAPAHLHSGAVEFMHAIYWQREGGGGSALGILDVIWFCARAPLKGVLQIVRNNVTSIMWRGLCLKSACKI